MPKRIFLRPANEQDYALALDLYLSTMRPLTAELMNWDEAKQVASFERQWQVEETQIIQCDGQDIGWLQVHEAPSEIVLQQLFVAPAHQRQGIGSSVLTRLLDEWEPRGKGATLTVLRNNPALHFYERFGFAVVEELGVKLRMRRTVLE